MSLRILIVTAMVAAAVSTASAEDASLSQRRVAIVVGANDPPPGGRALRFAHDDANQMADTLRRVGRFTDVRVLLDPHQADLLAAIDDVDRQARGSGGNALVVFYYSGHSDGQSIYPHGEQVAIADIRARLARLDARIRVGILDTCRGGAWTQTKGLSVAPPLDPVDLLDVGTEGTALVASSAGLEDAHETDAMHGSFFTHHLSAGLLGAADRNADHEVTLQEAFEYARERTVRDSALLATTPQHPSFEINLRGRQDIVLATASASPSALELSAPRSVLQVVYLATGLVIAEAPPSAKQIRLAVAPGSYLVRRVDGGRVWAKEVAVAPGQTTPVTEAELELTGTALIAVKGALDTVPSPSSPASGQRILQIAAGVATGPVREWGPSTIQPRMEVETPFVERSGDGLFNFSYGITDRLTWAAPAPAFSYRFGRAGALEFVPRGGITALGYSSVQHLIAIADAGAAVRAWTSPATSIIASTALDYESQTGRGPSVLTLHGDVGLAWDPSPSVTLHFAGGVAVPHRTSDPMAGMDILRTSFTFGSIQTLAYRALPLVQVHVTPSLSLDGYASWAVDKNGGVTDRYLAGISWKF